MPRAALLRSASPARRRGGAVAQWRRAEADGVIEMIAENAQSEPIGLVVRGPRSAI